VSSELLENLWIYAGQKEVAKMYSCQQCSPTSCRICRGFTHAFEYLNVLCESQSFVMLKLLYPNGDIVE
jgi:hypothetical protein